MRITACGLANLNLRITSLSKGRSHSKGRAKLPLSRKRREIRLGRSLALPETEFLLGRLPLYFWRLLRGWLLGDFVDFLEVNFFLIADKRDSVFLITVL